MDASKNKQAIFLDRDGVINRAFVVNGRPIPPRSLVQLEILPGVLEAITALRIYGFEIVVVTNQPDVGRKIVSESSVVTINESIQELTGIVHFYTCFHDDSDGCLCRKPKPGLLELAAEKLGINLKESYMVGDRWRDIEAGQRAGCSSYFIDYAYEEKSPQMPYVKVFSLSEAARYIQEDFNDRFSR